MAPLLADEPGEKIQGARAAQADQSSPLPENLPAALAAEIRKAAPDLCRLNEVDWERFSLPSLSRLMLEPGALAEDASVSRKFLQFLSARTPAEAGRVLQDESRAEFRFLRALVLAGLMIGAPFGDEEKPIDLAAARKLLVRLQIERPANGAIPYFLAVVEQRMSLREEQVRLRVRQTFAATEFDLFIDFFWRELFLTASAHPAYFYPARAGARNSPYPNIVLGAKLLRDAITNSPELADKALPFAEALSGLMLNRRDYPEATFFDYFPYGLGRNLIRHAYRITGRDEATLPAWTKPSTVDELFAPGLQDLRRQTLLADRSKCSNDAITSYVRAVMDQINDYRWRFEGNKGR